MTLPFDEPFPIFDCTNGQPLDNGYVYIGVENLDPVLNPIDLFWDEALTVPATQPLHTDRGYLLHNGQRAQVYPSAGRFSISIRNRQNAAIEDRPSTSQVMDLTLVKLETLLASNEGAGMVIGTARFAGALAVAPTTRIDGSPLQEGDEYQNTVDHLRYNWNGSAWIALNSSAQDLETRLAAPDGAGLVGYGAGSVKNTLDDLKDTTDPAAGAAALGRSVVAVSSVAELLDSPLQQDKLYLTKGYYTGDTASSSFYRYDPSVPRSSHNGGSIISPTVPWTSTLRDFINGSGDTEPGANGCFVALGNEFTPAQFGAQPVTSNSPSGFDSWSAVQSLLSYLDTVGGAMRLDAMYKVDYVLFVGNNTRIYGAGKGTGLYFLDPTLGRTGRGGLVFGAWHEADPTIGIPKGKAGDYTSPLNAAFVELPLGTYLRDNLSAVKCSKSLIYDVELTPIWSASTDGGYAVNFANAIDCFAWNIWGDDWTELINMGSDVAPTTPSCHNCHARNLYVSQPNNTRCYYTIGFIANSTQCSIGDAQVSNWSTDNQADGVYIVASEDCLAYRLMLNAGSKVFTAGVGDTRGAVIQGGRRNKVLDVTAIGLHNTLAIEQDLNATNLPASWSDKNEAVGITSSRCVFADVRMTGAMYGEIRSILEVSGTQQLRYSSTTAHFKVDLKRGWAVAASDSSLLQSLTDIELGVPISRVIQSGLANYKTGTSITPTRVTGNSTTPPVVYHTLDDLHTVTSLAAFGTFAAGGLTAGSVGTMALFGQATYNSNSNESAQLIAQDSVSSAAASDSSIDFSLSKAINKTILGQQPTAINNLVATLTYSNVSAGSAWKSMRVNGFGYNNG